MLKVTEQNSCSTKLGEMLKCNHKGKTSVTLVLLNRFSSRAQILHRTSSNAKIVQKETKTGFHFYFSNIAVEDQRDGMQK